MAIFRFIANTLASLTLLAAAAAWWHPPLFLIFKPVFIWLFAATMLAVGVTQDREELVTTLKQPLQIAQGVLTQYVVMPLLAFGIVTLADLPPALALGFIIVGAAPGAMASNVMVYLAGGAVALSIAMTTVAIIIICAYAMANAVNHNALAMQAYGLSVLGLVVLLNALGYAGGWILARLYGFDRRRRLTLAIEIGMQNAGLGVVLALAHFADQPQTALPGALFAVWCIVTAAGATHWFRRRAAALTADTPV